MTDEQIRIAIAESVGFYFGTEDSCREECWRDKNGLVVSQLPNYPSDLNAMHEMENHLLKESNANPISDKLWSDYRDTLEWITGPLRMAHATARQRAEAYLRVKGLWKD